MDSISKQVRAKFLSFAWLQNWSHDLSL